MIDTVYQMILGFIKDNGPRLKKELCDWASEKAAESETPWDDRAVDLLKLILGVE